MISLNTISDVDLIMKREDIHLHIKELRDRSLLLHKESEEMTEKAINSKIVIRSSVIRKISNLKNESKKLIDKADKIEQSLVAHDLKENRKFLRLIIPNYC